MDSLTCLTLAMKNGGYAVCGERAYRHNKGKAWAEYRLRKRGWTLIGTYRYALPTHLIINPNWNYQQELGESYVRN